MRNCMKICGRCLICRDVAYNVPTNINIVGHSRDAQCGVFLNKRKNIIETLLLISYKIDTLIIYN